MKLALAKWKEFSAKRLPPLNQQLQDASLPPIVTGKNGKQPDESPKP
jgi:hypothetical protein